ncbi:hypothetical protein F2Q70_00044977 [Brassica cretica]|uniref:Gnk2-homologous domain-containing protein n=1 Tax=Brassica cretica TaxID=69181 RepID=A0A8S9KGA6_BRACR|nr:hypothetical protein F2Q70_00044977 [Brassica cretica]
MINLLVSFWFVLISSTAYANTCLNRSGFFAPDGTYDLNRRVMLSTLPSNVTANDGFYTTSTGQDPNRVYGLGMCFPGIEAGSCSDCIMAASNGLVQNCTTQTEAIDWRMYRNTLCLLMADYREDPSARCEYLDWRCFISPWERMTRCEDLSKIWIVVGRCFISPYYNTIVSQIEVKINSNCERNCSNWEKFKSVSM